MAKLFNITLPAENTNLKLNPKQKSTVTYTVTNLTDRQVRGRAVLKPDDTAVKNKWVTIAGEVEKDFDEKSSTFQFPVNVNVPVGAAPGKYTFRLDAVNAAIPDEGDTGPTVGLEIVASQKAKMPGWLIPVIVVAVLAVAGTITLLLLHKSAPAPAVSATVAMPDVVGKDITAANGELIRLRLSMQVTTAASSSAAQANKVISQDPPKDAQVEPEKTAVKLTVGAPLLRVPSLIGLSVESAQLQLAALHFRNVQAATRPVQNVNPGFVSAQNPDAGQEVLADAVIHLIVAEQMKVVPQVTGMTFGNAVLALRNAGLDYGTVSGAQIDGTVLQQTPGGNTTVPVGTKINLVLPGCPRPGPFCNYQLDRTITGVYLMQNRSYNLELQKSMQRLAPVR